MPPSSPVGQLGVGSSEEVKVLDEHFLLRAAVAMLRPALHTMNNAHYACVRKWNGYEYMEEPAPPCARGHVNPMKYPT